MNRNPWKNTADPATYYWNFNNDIRSNDYDFPTIIIHEMGHAIGLDHYNECGGAMNSVYQIGGSKRLIVCDDANGIRAIYGANCGGNTTTDEKCYGGCPGRYSICFRYRGMDKGFLLLKLTEALEPFRVPGCFMDYADAVYAAFKEEIDAFACVHPDITLEIMLLADELAAGLDVPLTPVQELGKILTAEDIKKVEKVLDKVVRVVSPGLAQELEWARPLLRGLEGRKVGDILYEAYTRPMNATEDFVIEKTETFWFKPIVFKGHVEFVFNVPEKTEIRLAVYDGIGWRVKAFWGENATVYPGEHHIIWDGTNTQGRLVPSGIYIYRIETSDGGYQAGRFLYIME